MQIYEVTDPLFKEYGKIIDSVELTLSPRDGRQVTAPTPEMRSDGMPE